MYVNMYVSVWNCLKFNTDKRPEQKLQHKQTARQKKCFQHKWTKSETNRQTRTDIWLEETNSKSLLLYKFWNII